MRRCFFSQFLICGTLSAFQIESGKVFQNIRVLCHMAGANCTSWLTYQIFSISRSMFVVKITNTNYKSIITAQSKSNIKELKYENLKNVENVLKFQDNALSYTQPHQRVFADRWWIWSILRFWSRMSPRYSTSSPALIKNHLLLYHWEDLEIRQSN